MPAEIAGDLFKPYIGLVNQITYVPVGRLMPWKMTRCTLDPDAGRTETPNSAVPNFSTSVTNKRKTTGKMEQACFDLLFNIYGFNPNLTGAGTPSASILQLRDGLAFRMLCQPAMTVAGPIGIGDTVGVPTLGTAGEIPAAVPVGSIYAAAGVPGPLGTLTCYIFLACAVTKIHHMADAAAGQPFDFDFETIWPYCVPGEGVVQLGAYGFSATVGAGGFL